MHRLLALWIRLRSSLWFLPSVIVLFAVVLGLFLSAVGNFIPMLAQDELPVFFGFGAEGSRAMLSAIATSMITVAGVAFSITIVALSLASQQYSPRVLRHFMRDQGNQTVLGVFVGVFAYCLVVLPSIRGGDHASHVPALAVLVGVVLALCGVTCLIYFIHHVATAIQASAILTAVATETHAAISLLFPETLGREAGAPPCDLNDLHWHPIASPATGYLQMVDETTLLRWANETDCVLRMEGRVGDFILRGAPLVSASRSLEDNADATAAIATTFAIDRTRSIEQDASFGLRQIVDVALRALSPSLNDTTTAVLCINHLADLLRHTAARQPESPYRVQDGKLRVIAQRAEFDHMVALAFDQIRESGTNNVVVLDRLLWAIAQIEERTTLPARRETLSRAALAVGATAERTLADPAARATTARTAADLARRCQRPGVA
ncbi:MAG TPA: DUF2254 domain-containing protein [Opitutus sp.]|nr:DUF2254 domain-containing protein [Opitutus sp.]